MTIDLALNSDLKCVFLNNRLVVCIRTLYNIQIDFKLLLTQIAVLMYIQEPRLNFVANENWPIRFGCQKFFMRCSNNIDQSHNLCSSLRTRREIGESLYSNVEAIKLN